MKVLVKLKLRTQNPFCENWTGLRGAEAGVRLGTAAAGPLLAGDTLRHGARYGVAGAGGTLKGLVCDDLPQGVLLLHLEDVGLLRLFLADPRETEGEFALSATYHFGELH